MNVNSIGLKHDLKVIIMVAIVMKMGKGDLARKIQR